jgi:hypothetical protein
MKKSLIIIALSLLVVITSMLFMGLFNTYGFDREDDKISLYLNQHQWTDNADLVSYEFIYLHVSYEDQDFMDYQFADQLMKTDLNQKSVTEVMDLIAGIKLEIIDEFQFEYSNQGYGMMGGYMMGFNRNDQTTSCLYGSRTSSFEWVYIHLSETEKLEIDQKFAEAIMFSDLNTYTIDELVAHIDAIKLDLLNMI